jgi:hypothetical protein
LVSSLREGAAGHRVYFTTAMDFARKLTRAVDANRLHRDLNALQQPKLLIIDEVGYLPFDAVQASLLFQVICRRYQKNQPMVLTSNKALGERGEVFGGDPVMASAALDRLLHRSTTINIRGESYRLREKRRAGIDGQPAALTDGQRPQAQADYSRMIVRAPECACKNDHPKLVQPLSTNPYAEPDYSLMRNFGPILRAR